MSRKFGINSISRYKQAQGAGVQRGLLPRRQVPGLWLVRQVRAHLVHRHREARPQLQGHGGHLRGVLEQQGRQGELHVLYCRKAQERLT